MDKQVVPLTSIAAGLGLAGGAKLAGAQFTRDNFDRWGYGQRGRILVGAIEVGVAGAAVAGIADRSARPIAAVGTLLSMAGALATHARAGDAAPNYGPPIALAAAGVAVLLMG